MNGAGKRANKNEKKKKAGNEGIRPSPSHNNQSNDGLREHINSSQCKKGAMRQKATKGIRKENEVINLLHVLGILIVCILSKTMKKK